MNPQQQDPIVVNPNLNTEGGPSAGPQPNPAQQPINNYPPDGPNQSFQQPTSPQPGLAGGQAENSFGSYASPPAQPNPTPNQPPTTPSPQFSAMPGQPRSFSGGSFEVNSGMTPPKATMPAKEKFGGKKLLIILSILFVLGSLGAAYFSFIYWPNTPNNVWSMGLNRSGEALNKLVSEASEQKALEEFSKSSLTATIDGQSGDSRITGTLDSKFNSNKSNSELKLKANLDKEELDLGFKVLSEFQEEQTYPNIYLQYYGLKAAGLDAFLPAIADYDGKWIAIESEYLQSVIPVDANSSGQESEQSTNEQLSAAEVTEIAKVVSEATSEYLFTTDSDKAVIELRLFVGKEEVDGKNTYHYRASLNQQHAKDYCSALVERVTALPSIQRVIGDQVEDYKKDGLKECAETEIDDNQFDLWVDAKYKLIYKVRLSDKDNDQAYVDIGQDYNGSDDISFFINYRDDQQKNEVQTSVTTNLSTKKTSANMTIGSTAEDLPYDIKIDVQIEPYDGEVDTNKPKDSISIEEVLEGLGIAPEALPAELN
jgi:hypothetical protein